MGWSDSVGRKTKALGRSEMRITIIILLLLLAMLMTLCYALLVIASNADVRAEEFWKEWEDE